MNKKDKQSYGRYAKQNQINDPFNVTQLDLPISIPTGDIVSVMDVDENWYKSTYPHDSNILYHIRGTHKIFLGDVLYSNKPIEPMYYLSGSEDTFVIYYKGSNGHLQEIQTYDNLEEAYKKLLLFEQHHSHNPIKINMRGFIKRYLDNEIDIFEVVKGVLGVKFNDTPKFNAMVIHMNHIQDMVTNKTNDNELWSYFNGMGPYDEMVKRILDTMYMEKYITKNCSLDDLSDKVFRILGIN